MKKIRNLFIFSVTAFTVLCASVQAQEQPALVLVHGAHFSANAWQQVQTLVDHRFKSYAIDLPGRNDKITPAMVSLEISAAVLCKSMATIQGDKVLVAHSQGGSIVNASLDLCPEEPITKIIYVTSVAPLNNTEVFSKLSKEDEKNYFTGVTFNENSELLEITNQLSFTKNFAQDANKSQREWLNKNAVAEPASVGGSKVTLNEKRYQEIDKYYIFAKNDRIISLASQHRIAQSINLKSSFQLDSGHLPMLTHSQALADILMNFSQR